MLRTMWSEELQEHPVEVDLRSLTLWLSRSHTNSEVVASLILNYARLLSVHTQDDIHACTQRASCEVLGLTPERLPHSPPRSGCPVVLQLGQDALCIPQHLPLV